MSNYQIGGYRMTIFGRGITRTTGALLALLLLLAGTLGAMPPGGGAVPRGSNELHSSTVTIKTLDAANDALREGAVRGIDVSKYQGTINWSKVAQDNVHFAMIRATYGTTNDPTFVTNAQGAHENGLAVGAYHYATFHDGPSVKKEAAQFISQLRKANITYPVALDLEAAKYTKASRKVVTQLAKMFMDAVRAEGYTVMLYSYNNFIRDHVDLNMIDDYDLWVANYLESPNISHKLWQHTSYGTVSGIAGRVDINIAYSNMGKGTGKRKIQVDGDVSASIKQTLNERYDAGLSLEGLDMTQMTKAINSGLQHEINRQFGQNLLVDGALDRDVANTLASITFTSETGGNITYLLQAKLFYKGCYTGQLTARFDENTVAAVKAYQQLAGITADGHIDAPTLRALLLN